MTTIQSLGLMSGTSMDGIDAALVRTDGQADIQTLATRSLHYPSGFTRLLKACEQAAHQVQGQEAELAIHFNTVWRTALHERPLSASQQDELRDCFSQTDLNAITYAQVVAKSTAYHQQLIDQFSGVELIAYHGQTLYHQAQQGISLQMGDAQQLAHHNRCPVISRFRQADLLAGGQGAPLAPIYHHGLACRDQIMPLAVINCGGIANITVLSEPNAPIIGFDCGPGNVLLDRVVRTRHPELTYDRDAMLGRQGQLQPELLNACWQTACIKPDFFNQPPPKSLDSYDFQLPAACENYSIEDVCHTLAVFTAQTIVHGLLRVTHCPERLVLAGGGWQNPLIQSSFMEALNAHGQFTVLETWDQAYLEAELMAYLGVRVQNQYPTTFPTTTGVPSPVVGGQQFEV